MTEVIKTLIFAGVAIAISMVAAFVSWPRAAEQSESRVGTALFEQFTDPLAASSMKIVTFDDETGQLSTFEVRKDPETEEWTIPSRDGYPADALEQMKNAANAFVALKVLDTQTDKAEDHDDLGVAEPKLEDLQVGDEGVGRLVTLKDGKQQTIAELIIGDVPKDDPSQRYVRVPGQDPVYVVRFDDSPLTTAFREWIDNDLLQLSSIELSSLEILDYNASLAMGGKISLTRNYTADVGLDGTEWKLNSLMDYDASRPGAAPVAADLASLAPLNKTKLDELKTALDDLQIADVVRKPDGMSETLRADQNLLTDKEAVNSLAQRGFYPVPSGPNGEIEILSANGELDVILNTGVKYILRFGNISGIEDSNADSEAGVNRYLLVTTKVDDTQFPPPELQAVPKTVEELKAKMTPAPENVSEGEVKENPEVSVPEADASDKKEASTDEKPETPQPANETPQPANETPQPTSEPAGTPALEEKPEVDAAPQAETPEDAGTEPEPTDEIGTQPDKADTETGVSKSSGSGEATGTGQAQQQEDGGPATNADEAVVATEPDKKDKTEAATSQDDTSNGDTANSPPSTPPATEPATNAAPKDDADVQPESKELTEEEWQEMLEAEQEKVIKQNQRMLDERKDRLEDAQRRVRDLNARFADWYYVIPEATYSKLRFKRADLFEQPAGTGQPQAPGIPGLPGGLPQFNFPGAPGN